MRALSVQEIITIARERLSKEMAVFDFVMVEEPVHPEYPVRYAAPSEDVYPLMLDWLFDNEYISEDERALAMLPFAEVPPDDRAERAAILEHCRLLFTEWLHQAIEGRPLNIHWTTVTTPEEKERGIFPRFKQ